MRGVLAATVLCAALCGCQKEPTFDERYEAAQASIKTTAMKIDRDLAASETANRDVVKQQADMRRTAPAGPAKEKSE